MRPLSPPTVERGNILFLILLAVVLFAGLSYAVTQSMRGGGKDGGDENAAIVAAQIINAISLQETELMRFMERTKLAIHQIDFIGPHGSAGSTGNNPNCGSTTCDLWHANGGKVTQPVLPKSAADWGANLGGWCAIPSGAFRSPDGGLLPYMSVVSVTGVGTPASDLVLAYGCVKPEICEEINIAEGIKRRGDPAVIGPGSAGSMPYADYFSNTPSSGLADTADDYTATGESRLISRRLWCYEKYSDNRGGIIYAVLYAQ